MDGIEKLIDQLNLIQKTIAAGDDKEVIKLLEKAARKRAKMIQCKIDQKELF